MPLPEISFSSQEDQLQYGVKTLVEAGFTPEQIDTVRTKLGTGPGKIPYSKELVGQRRYMVQELLAASLSNKQIAEVLKLSKETVNSDRGFNRSLWTNEILKSHDTWRARLLQEQGELKDQALRAFDASKRKRVTTTRNGEDSIVREEESAGESSFLSVARSCLEQQAKLLGLFDVKAQSGEKSGYKAFLQTLGKEVKKIQDAESNSEIRSLAIDASVSDEQGLATTAVPIELEFDDDGEPIGNSRPMLSAEDYD